MTQRTLRFVKHYDWEEVNRRVSRMAHVVEATIAKRLLHIYAVPPNGDVPTNMLREQLQAAGWMVAVATKPEEADLFIDAAVNTGTLQNEYVNKYRKSFLALVVKRDQGGERDKDAWIVFPWEDPAEAQAKIDSMTFDNEHFNKTEVSNHADGS